MTSVGLAPAAIRRRRQRRRTGAAVVAAVGGGTAALVLAWLVLAERATRTDLAARLQPPSWQHPLGTDQLGRDVLVRLAHGGAATLTMTAVVLAVSLLLGTTAGLAAAAGSGRLRGLVLATTDTLLAVPGVLVALAVAAAAGTGTGPMLGALVAVGWTPYCRLAHGLASVTVEELYVEAARAAGASRRWIMGAHVLPNIAGPVIGHAAARAGNTVLTVSALSYLGLGPQPPSAEWGAMLAASQPYLERAPLAVAAPALAISATALVAITGGGRIRRRLAGRGPAGLD